MSGHFHPPVSLISYSHLLPLRVFLLLSWSPVQGNRILTNDRWTQILGHKLSYSSFFTACECLVTAERGERGEEIDKRRGRGGKGETEIETDGQRDRQINKPHIYIITYALTQTHTYRNAQIHVHIKTHTNTRIHAHLKTKDPHRYESTRTYRPTQTRPNIHPQRMWQGCGGLRKTRGKEPRQTDRHRSRQIWTT